MMRAACIPRRFDSTSAYGNQSNKLPSLRPVLFLDELDELPAVDGKRISVEEQDTLAVRSPSKTPRTSGAC
jgi:hypothetical protein